MPPLMLARPSSAYGPGGTARVVQGGGPGGAPVPGTRLYYLLEHALLGVHVRAHDLPDSLYLHSAACSVNIWGATFAITRKFPYEL